MIEKSYRPIFLLIIAVFLTACSTYRKSPVIQDVVRKEQVVPKSLWLTHEHILVDFIGADNIQPESWNHDSVIRVIMPYLRELKKYHVNYFVDATPNYLGRDVLLLEKLSRESGLRIITNTGLYGARNNKYIPGYAWELNADDLAKEWTGEYINGIDGTSVKPGFIKISVDNRDPLSAIHQKLVKAAALTHLNTGLTIASHTGKAEGLWPQLEILGEIGVSASAFIWIHAQNENNNASYLKAAEKGCWISLDGVGSEVSDYVVKILFAKENGILDRILISHDAGWYDPQKEKQEIKPYTVIFEKLYPALKARGFTDEEFDLLISANPSEAFSIKIRKEGAE